MIDLKWDFNANDIILTSGFFEIGEPVSTQNGALIFNKSAANILRPEVGVGFENYYANIPSNLFGRVQAAGERQMRADGAIVATVRIIEANSGIPGERTADIYVRYRE